MNNPIHRSMIIHIAFILALGFGSMLLSCSSAFPGNIALAMENDPDLGNAYSTCGIASAETEGIPSWYINYRYYPSHPGGTFDAHIECCTENDACKVCSDVFQYSPPIEAGSDNRNTRPSVPFSLKVLNETNRVCPLPAGTSYIKLITKPGYRPLNCIPRIDQCP